MWDDEEAASVNAITSGVEQISLAEDFRNINVFPTVSDISIDSPHLRVNKIVGKYEGVDDYLDTQFRLLHEDFFGPLRNGIKQFREDQQRNNPHLSVYTNATFVPNHNSPNNRCVYVINFHCSYDLHADADQRLKYGSLLCLSSDSFQSMIFATILDFTPRNDKFQRVEIQLDPKVKFDPKFFYRQYIMIESRQYFEPYRQVLATLQNIAIDTCFPLGRYILDAHQNVDPPFYLNLDPDLFCSPEFDTFDKSQKEAYVFALTKELAIIQGPPGTGKTFIGLKIVAALLEHARTQKRPPPILVVCYTNHALDQFLEGIIDLGLSRDVVRIGSMSKSEPLAEFSLANRRKTDRGGSMMPYHDELRSASSHLRDLQNDIYGLLEKRGIISIASISALPYNENFILPDFNFQPFTCRGELSDTLFLSWLNGCKSPGKEKAFIMPHECFGTQKEIRSKQQLSERSGMAYAMIFDDVKKSIDTLREMLDDNSLFLENEADTKDEWVKKFRSQIAQLQFMMKSLKQERPALSMQNIYTLCKTNHIWQLPLDNRWYLYYYWESQVHEHLMREIHETEVPFHLAAANVDTARQIHDVRLLKDVDVIGMTTSSAARLHEMMAKLRIRTVIVEEAAEVLEGHLVSSLTEFCQHLILIGDHQQLRPKTSVHELARQYKLDVSLFERMLNNQLPCVTLQVQHRMRPEIAELITPAIYPQLNNHPSVFGRDDMLGIDNNVFFITHHKLEQQRNSAYSTSYLNPHEGDFLLALCLHLVNQGYNQEQITIIATYADQVQYLLEHRSAHSRISDVRVSSVDGYQGEENDIILLSLVRSNQQGNIGFLRTPNRVCVALSRARIGLYIVGNMANLLGDDSVWRKIISSLSQQNAVELHMTLRCQNHPEQLTRVASAADFLKISGGGCMLPCAKVMKCHHTCKQSCHVYDPFHLTDHYRCQMKCARDHKDCLRGHQCNKLCWESCDFCMVPVDYALHCGHVATLPCKETFMEEDFICKAPRIDIQPCGHEANRPCHAVLKGRPYHCALVANNELPCGHFAEVPCDDRRHKCMKAIVVQFPWCGHSLIKMCYKDMDLCQCNYPCTNLLTCGHNCPLKCHKILDPQDQKFKFSCSNRESGNHPCSLPECMNTSVSTSQAASVNMNELMKNKALQQGATPKSSTNDVFPLIA